MGVGWSGDDTHDIRSTPNLMCSIRRLYGKRAGGAGFSREVTPSAALGIQAEGCDHEAAPRRRGLIPVLPSRCVATAPVRYGTRKMTTSTWMRSRIASGSFRIWGNVGELHLAHSAGAPSGRTQPPTGQSPA